MSARTIIAAFGDYSSAGLESWDSYGLTITESQFKANVDWMSQHLKRYGWQYAVIDEGWYLSDPASGGKPAWHYTVSGNGLYFPAVDRFPSAASDIGFKAEADYVHKAGLKFGFHIIRGIPRVAVEKNLPIALISSNLLRQSLITYLLQMDSLPRTRSRHIVRGQRRCSTSPA